MRESQGFNRRAIDRRGLIVATIGAGVGFELRRTLAFTQEASAPAATIEVQAEAVAWPKYNLNAASTEQFKVIPGAGEQMTREFEEYRPYTSNGQFRGEMGKYISPEEVAAFERYLFVPVAPSQADADTLQQLPGVNADVAQSLVAEGPFDSVEAFLAALETTLSPEFVTVAKTYVAQA
jgi:DNA uptake protein ComE-like DNA-binding protein